MSMLEIFRRLSRQADLMDAMMNKLGVSEQMRQLPDRAAVLRRATNRCLACDQPDACREWLTHETHREKAPSYCRNYDLFARMLSQTEAETHTAA